MRIFMLVQHPDAGGPVSKHGLELVEALRAHGCTVVTHPWGRRSPRESPQAKLRQRIGDVLSVRSALRAQEFDVAVVKTAHDWKTLVRDVVLVAAMGSRCPVVLQLHGSRASRLAGSGHRLFKRATAALLSRVDGVLVLSTEEQRQWQAFRSRPPVVTVRNPFVPVSPRRAAAPGSERPRVLFVGRLLAEKGIFDLVAALPKVLRQLECEATFVGAGRDEGALRERIIRDGLREHVVLTGHLSGSELADAYGSAAVFVLPTSYPEGFPTVLAEAMDAGLPIVTTRIRGAADHLVDGENALFVAPHDVDGLASAIVTVLRDPELRRRMGSSNRARVAMFAPDVVAREYLEALAYVVRRR